jgi:phosphoglycerol transferase
MLTGYYIIPLGIMLIIFIVNGKEIFLKRKPNSHKPSLDFSRRSILATLTCILIASTGVYYAFFQSLLMGVLGTVTSFQKKNWLIFLRTATFCGIIFIVSILNVAPSILYQQKHGPNQLVAKRLPGEAENFGLRITQLLLPTTDHRIPLFSKIKAKYNQAVGISESDWATLGLFGSIGFGFLLITILGKVKKHQYLLEPLSKLNIIALLFATIGGFGSLFSFYVMANFRGQNRMSIIIAFLALFAFGILLELLFNKIKWEWFKTAFITALLIFGIWDQTAPQFVINQEYIKPQFNLEKRFVEKIEKIVPPQAMIYQLPFSRYPEGGPVHFVQDYQMLKGYFHSKELRWSYGAMKERETERLILHISTLDPKYMVNSLYKLGFAGIYIDRNGYTDQAQELEAKLNDILNVQPIVSEDNRLSFFSLSNFKSEIATSDYWKQELEIFNQDNSLVVQPKYLMGEDWWINESTHRWTNGYKADMLLYVENPDKDLSLNLQMYGLVNSTVLKAQRVIVFLNDREIGKLEVS